MKHLSIAGGVGVLCCMAIISGCMPANRAIPESAQLEIPATWMEASSKSSDVEPEWWGTFGDPVLGEIITTALSRNSDILLSAAYLEQAYAELRLAGAAQGPAVDVDVGMQAGRALGAGGVGSSRSVQPDVVVNWEVDIWGKLRYQTLAAKEQFKASQADYDAVALSIASSVANTYISLLSLEEQLHQTKATLQSREKALSLAQDKFAAGYISQLELTQAESEYQAVKQRVPQLELAVSRHENALRLLAGELPGTYRDANKSSLSALLLPQVMPGLPSELLRRRPDIAQAELELASKDAALAGARAAFLPQVSLSARAGALYTNALDYNPATVWSLGGSILAPLFDRGRLEAQFDSIAAQRDAAAYKYRGVTLKAFSEVENALAGRSRLEQELEYITKRRDVLMESLKHATNRYEAGYAPYLEQLDAQRNLYEVQIQVIVVRQEQLQNTVDLYKALGGGWETMSHTIHQRAPRV